MKISFPTVVAILQFLLLDTSCSSTNLRPNQNVNNEDNIKHNEDVLFWDRELGVSFGDIIEDIIEEDILLEGLSKPKGTVAKGTKSHKSPTIAPTKAPKAKG